MEMARQAAGPGDTTHGGLVKVTAPEGVHIIDQVSRDWLWRQPRPLVQHSLPASLRERVRT
jgi:hypothetical protein